MKGCRGAEGPVGGVSVWRGSRHGARARPEYVRTPCFSHCVLQFFSSLFLIYDMKVLHFFTFLVIGRMISQTDLFPEAVSIRG
jgi:hypothetical protein